MKRFFIIAAAALLLTSCTITKYISTTDYVVESIESQYSPSAKFEAGCITDSLVTMSCFMGERSLGIHIANNSNNTIKVLWDSGAFIDLFGLSHRIVHTEVKMIEKNNAQVPTVIPKHSRIEDGVTLSDNITYGSNGWDCKSLTYNGTFDSEEEAKNATKGLGRLTLLLPIECNGKVYEYTINFEGTGNKVTTESYTDGDSVLWGTTAVSIGLALLMGLCVGI